MSSLAAEPGAAIAVTRLGGRLAAVARVAWLAVAAAAVLTFLGALPARWALLTYPSPTTLANLGTLGLTPTLFAAYSLCFELVIAAPYVVVGFLIWWRCRDEGAALLTALVLVVFGTGSGTITPTMRALLGLHPALDFLQHSFEFLAWVGFGLIFYLFPDGRWVPRWTRWLAAAWLPLCIVWNYAPDSPLSPPNWPVYLFVPVVGLMWASWAFSQWYRYRRVSGAVERQQTKWVVFALASIVSLAALSALGGAFVPGYNLLTEEQATPQAFAYMVGQWALSPLMAVLPVAIAFSVLRHRLWEIDALISRALVYGALTAFVVAVYVVVVGGLGALSHSIGSLLISLVATGLIAVAFQPLRARLQRLVSRMVYGERDDPYAVLSRFSQELDADPGPDSLLPTIVETIARTLKLPYAAIVLREGSEVEIAAAFGTPAARSLALPLTYQHRLVGELHVAPRSPAEPFTAVERRLLGDIAARTAIAVHNARLAADLQRSREQLVAAREEERRRLRRDLHDGLGPKLAAQALKLEAALDSLEGETETARALLEETMADSQTVVAEIRRLVYGLRPPALDQLGLLSAVRELAIHYQQGGLRVSVATPETLPPVPAAVEVATYRIIQEALTNVARHAQAATCLVALAVGEGLEVEVRDDGRGLPAEFRAGVGLSSMRERAEEVGGTCTVEPGSSGGTRVIARLPLASRG